MPQKALRQCAAARLIPTLLKQKTGEPLLETVDLRERGPLAQILRDRVCCSGLRWWRWPHQRNEAAMLRADRIHRLPAGRMPSALMA